MNEYDPNYVHVKQYFLVGQKAIIFNSQGKILIVQRSNKTSGGGKWSLPGGGMEKGEQPVSSIEREIDEETQLKVDRVQPLLAFCYQEEEDSCLIILYKAQAVTEEVFLNWEHDQFEWVEPEVALEKITLHPKVKEKVVAVIYDNSKTI